MCAFPGCVANEHVGENNLVAKFAIRTRKVQEKMGRTLLAEA